MTSESQGPIRVLDVLRINLNTTLVNKFERFLWESMTLVNITLTEAIYSVNHGLIGDPPLLCQRLRERVGWLIIRYKTQPCCSTRSLYFHWHFHWQRQ